MKPDQAKTAPAENDLSIEDFIALERINLEKYRVATQDEFRHLTKEQRGGLIHDVR